VHGGGVKRLGLFGLLACLAAPACHHVLRSPDPCAIVEHATLSPPSARGETLLECVRTSRVVGKPLEVTYHVAVGRHGELANLTVNGEVPKTLLACMRAAYEQAPLTPARDCAGQQVSETYIGRLGWSDLGAFVEYPGGKLVVYLDCGLSVQTSRPVPCPSGRTR
jgi:hypothetical protein